ncbi:hypothetical protein BO221_46880 [Archangium sp. Cb G35]|uniref:delta-60 repeat domain-containing protein n=1 Tax=Archangium sp. Cb G35 TaxID=1920190 RepID=UPI000936C0DA|nr:delta-60 repeat domain-containing protein [Archangium sp. Cb G35]OJT17248.1 hypothetical protein BO221_46880 [Archangium sp. Cb G35]
MHVLETSSPSSGFTASRHPLAMLLSLMLMALGAMACPGTPPPSTRPDAGQPQQRPDAGTQVDAGEPDSGIVDPEPDAGVEPPPPFTMQADAEQSLRFEPERFFPFDVRVTRQSSFTGSVALSVEGLPPHVQVAPVSIAETVNAGRLDFTLDEFAAYGHIPVKVVGEGGGKRVEHALTLDIQPGQAALDNAFGSNGIAMPGLGHPAVSINVMAVQPDGRWILVGSTGSTGLRDVLVARLLADGTPDASFGTNGVVVTDICGGDDFLDAVTVLPDGRILVAGAAMAATGNCSDTRYQSVLFARYTSTGAPDTTLGGTGVLTFRISSGSTITPAVLHAVAVDSQGRIVGAGTAQHDDKDILLMRISPTGAADNTFGGDGVVSRDLGTNEEGMGLVIQADGRLVVTAAQGNTNRDMVMQRFTTSGSLDVSFDYFSTWSSIDLVPRTLHLLSNGKFVVGGQMTRATGETEVFLARITSGGDNDTTFASSGYRFLKAGQNDTLAGTGVLPGGQLVAATWSKDAAGRSGIGVVHVSEIGVTLRTHRTDLPGEEKPGAALLDADGFLRVAGVRTSPEQPTEAPFVTRFWPY